MFERTRSVVHLEVLLSTKRNKKLKNVLKLDKYPEGLTTPTAGHLLPGGGGSISFVAVDPWPEVCMGP